MKRKANYNVKHKPGGGSTGWAARLVNDPLELLCFAGLCMVICWVITLFR